MKKHKLVYLLTIVALTFASTGLAKTFKSESLNDQLIEAMKKGNTLKEDSSVPTERLRLLTVQHIDFDGQEKIGEIIVLDVCAEAVISIFEALYKRRFPIHQIKLMHYYNGEDHAAVTDNNTSCYIDRSVVGNSQKKSLHAYGVAIDINPVQNPFVTMDKEKGIASYEPKAGIKQANRRLERLGKEPRKGMAEEVVDLFAANGFYWWGGYWNSPIDYQHFYLSKGLTELYLAMDPQTAKETFKKATKYYNQYKKPLEQVLSEQLQQEHKIEETLADCYQKNKPLFNQVLKKATKDMHK
jgi:hypothetical protein